ncbi:hypothetical protein RRG08_047334 [Elysia crispata]|uniref:Uncharacterized protein n=1 Tax=Elysia crispata TaxID=231223 RepID=A0AAE1AZZ4_9GAST|nr:hypothetical protein RRG08_047334 [Elysia crispata]
MDWAIVLSLLFHVLRSALSNPMFTQKNFEYTKSCSDDYLVEGKDFLLFEFEATGSNSTYPFNQGFRGPKFYFTSTASNVPVSPCSAFDIISNTCTNRQGTSNTCSCLEVQTARVYRFIFNKTAERILSNQSVWIEWPGPPAIFSKSYQIPEIRAKVEFLNFQSSFNTDEDFLVAGEDTTVIQFEVSGNNSVHTFDGKNGPQFYYTTTDMVSHEGCLGFDPGTGSCTKRTGVRDACSCEMKTSNKYWLSYTKTATLDTSRATVYLLWPGTPDLRSDNYTFPEIKGLVGLLATVAGVGVMCYKRIGGAEAINNNAHSRVPATGTTQMETDNNKQTVEEQKAEDNEIEQLDTSQNTVSSQTDATLV